MEKPDVLSLILESLSKPRWQWQQKHYLTKGLMIRTIHVPYNS